MILRIFFATIAALILAGCDGRIDFGDSAGAVENSSGRKLIRGLALHGESMNEDPVKTENRRDYLESIAERRNINLSDDLGEILRENKLYRNIVFREIDAESITLPIAFVQVEFDIEGGYSAQLTFVIEQMKMLKFIHLTKLPAFKSGIIKHGETTLPIMSDDLFIHLLSRDQNALKTYIDQKWNELQAKMLAEAKKLEQEAADKKTKCEEKFSEIEANSKLIHLYQRRKKKLKLENFKMNSMKSYLNASQIEINTDPHPNRHLTIHKSIYDALKFFRHFLFIRMVFIADFC